MRRLPVVPLLAFVLLSTGCLRDSDPLDVDLTPLQVHAVVQAGADSATILLSRPAKDRYMYVPVSGAEVYLLHGGASVRLREHAVGEPCAGTLYSPSGDGRGCYTGALPVPVQAGAVYDLDITVPGGARVTGQTRVPEPVQITAPDAGQPYVVRCAPSQFFGSCRSPAVDRPPYFEPLANILVAWDAPSGVTHVEVTFRSTAVFRDGVSYRGNSCQMEPETQFQPAIGRNGSRRWPVHSIYCGGPIDVIGWDSIQVEAVVAAYDSAYGGYMEAVLGRDAARIEAVSAGITGALGVFGAVSTSVRQLTLIRAQ